MTGGSISKSMRVLIGVAGAALAAGSALAAEPPSPAPGQWPTALVFETTPPRAQPKPGSACEAADRYVTFVSTDRAREVPGLFSEDGEFIGVENRVLRGPAEIATFYNGVHQGGAIPLSFIDHGGDCIMELAGKRPNVKAGLPDQYNLVAIDHFTVGADGKIKRLVIFFRPNAIQPAR